MFDSIKVVTPLHTTAMPDELRGFTVLHGSDRRGRWLKATRRPSRDDGSPSISLLARDDGTSHMAAEASLANLWFRTTGQALDSANLPAALTEFSARVSSLAGIGFDVSQARVHRLDAFSDFAVNEQDIPSFIDAALVAARGHLEPVRWGTSAYLRSRGRGREIIVYSKHKDALQLKRRRKASDDPERWRNVLRVEARFRNARACSDLARRQLRLPDSTTLHLLSPQVWEHIMGRTLKLLNFDRDSPACDDLMRKLVEVFGSSAISYYGFIRYRQEWGEDFWKLAGLSDSTFRRKRKALIDANLWTATAITSSLPKLELVRQSVKLERSA
jgi:hypothetical protein